MYKDRKNLPIFTNIRAVLEEKNEFTASVFYLKKQLKNIGYSEWRGRHTSDIFLERPDVLSDKLRLMFLGKIKFYRDNGHPGVYTNVNYVLFSCSFKIMAIIGSSVKSSIRERLLNSIMMHVSVWLMLMLMQC